MKIALPGAISDVSSPLTAWRLVVVYIHQEHSVAMCISRLTNFTLLCLPSYFAAHCRVILGHNFPTVQIAEVNEKGRPTNNSESLYNRLL